MLAYCPAPPHGLRRDRALTGPTDVDALSVVYVGQTAALLATRSGTLVPVTAGPTGLVPGGLGVPDQAALAPVLARWSELADGHRAAAIDLRAWHAAATAVELRIPAAARAGVTAAQLAELDRGLPDPPSGAAGFASAERAAELDPPRRSRRVPVELDACVAATVGAGIGTTPAGDDVICGVLAGLDLLGHAGAHGRLGAAVTPLLAATTRTSRHLLAAAVAGRYTEGLIGLAAALASASAPAVRDALDALARWGASSGLDQATGFAAAIRAGSARRGGCPMTATMTLAASVFPRLYRDSVALLALASKLQQREHIVRAGVVMATPANLRLLAESDMLPDGVAAGPDDLLITVKGGDPGAVEDALAFASTALSSTDAGSSEVSEQRPQTIAEGIAEPTRGDGGHRVGARDVRGDRRRAGAAARAARHVLLRQRPGRGRGAAQGAGRAAPPADDGTGLRHRGARRGAARLRERAAARPGRHRGGLGHRGAGGVVPARPGRGRERGADRGRRA